MNKEEKKLIKQMGDNFDIVRQHLESQRNQPILFSCACKKCGEQQIHASYIAGERLSIIYSLTFASTNPNPALIPIKICLSCGHVTYKEWTLWNGASQIE